MITFKINNNSKYPASVEISCCLIDRQIDFFFIVCLSRMQITSAYCKLILFLSSFNLQIFFFYIYCSLLKELSCGLCNHRFSNRNVYKSLALDHMPILSQQVRVDLRLCIPNRLSVVLLLPLDGPNRVARLWYSPQSGFCRLNLYDECILTCLPDLYIS